MDGYWKPIVQLLLLLLFYIDEKISHDLKLRKNRQEIMIFTKSIKNICTNKYNPVTNKFYISISCLQMELPINWLVGSLVMMAYSCEFMERTLIDTLIDRLNAGISRFVCFFCHIINSSDSLESFLKFVVPVATFCLFFFKLVP